MMRIRVLAGERDVKMQKAIKKKKALEDEKVEGLKISRAWKISEQRRRIEEIQARMIRDYFLRTWLGICCTEVLLRKIKKLKEVGLEEKRHMFLFNVKARIIQISMRRAIVRKKMLKMNNVAIELMRGYVRRWKKTKSCRRIGLQVLRAGIKLKVKAKMMLMRTGILK